MKTGGRGKTVRSLVITIKLVRQAAETHPATGRQGNSNNIQCVLQQNHNCCFYISGCV